MLASGSAAAEPPRGFAGVNAGLQLGSKGFSHSVAFDHALFGPERGRLQARHHGGGGGLFDFSAGETFLYYSNRNPAANQWQRKVTFVKRITSFGVPVLIGAGYYLD